MYNLFLIFSVILDVTYPLFQIKLHLLSTVLLSGFQEIHWEGSTW